MKKTYIEPALKCVKINAVNLLTISGDGLHMDISSEGASSDADARELEFDDEY
jgi:hypothetical protein